MRRPLLVGFLGAVLLVVLVLPFVLHTNAFISKLRSNQEKWSRLAPRSYEMVIASNSLSDPTGGINVLRVENGQIVQAENADCGDCSLDDFNHLTVEALFERIWEECVRNHARGLPFPICNVAYDQDLGFPRRLDTYTFTQEGEYLPSITIETFQPYP